ncbi:MAG TPA: serine hydrolase [Mycobacteriales bacterium]|nr:serine hydrolase [Mycobacteriales bacterium]
MPVVSVVLLSLLGLALSPVVAYGATPRTLRLAARPSLQQRLTRYANSRRGSVTVAVYDVAAHRLTLVHDRDRFVTASIVKVDILQTLLYQRHGHLSGDERSLAKRMIEQSDNDAASALWNDVGGAAGVHRYNKKIGLTQTHPHSGGEWGLTTTSARDQVTLVRNLSGPSSVLSTSWQRYARGLMRHVTSDQRWGISSGPSAHAVVGLKNGWLPVASDRYRWEVNSIGWVRGSDRRYQIAVLTAHQPSEGYGIDTIEHLAKLVWAHVTRS